MFQRFKKLKFFDFLRPAYHYALAFLGAVFFRFPSRKIKVVAVTGTKGKTSTIEILGAILEEAGYKTALLSTLRFKIGDEEERNLFKMTMPGRFFIQRFLRKAVDRGADYAVIEMTSEGAKQYRHKFISLDALIFTNLTPEHIESHGSYSKYLEAKLKIAHSLEKSGKKERIMVSNRDDEAGRKFLEINNAKKIPYSLKDAEPIRIFKEGVEFIFEGEKINSYLSGKFNVYNILAAAKYGLSQGISAETIKRAVEKFKGIRGRVESVERGQDFKVIVDYAHTPDSLEKLYEVFGGSKKICVLGNTGGGRDRWKRPDMAKIAQAHCDEIILTNEDPYDEDPQAIISEMAEVLRPGSYRVILDRAEAIEKAVSLAEKGDAVLITGKGTDPYIMGPNGEKTAWDDAEIAGKAIDKLLKK